MQHTAHGHDPDCLECKLGLEAQWMVVQEPLNPRYYYNKLTGETQWTRPTKASEPESSWKEYFSGRRYWHNVTTNEVTWRCPFPRQHRHMVNGHSHAILLAALPPSRADAGGEYRSASDFGQDIQDLTAHGRSVLAKYAVCQSGLNGPAASSSSPAPRTQPSPQPDDSVRQPTGAASRDLSPPSTPHYPESPDITANYLSEDD